MPIRINRLMNIVIDLESDDGKYFVHSEPIGKAVFDAHWLLLSKTWALLMSQGLNVVAGPPVAYLALKDVAIGLNQWEQAQQSLIAEIARLTSVISLGSKGWQSLPLETMRVKELIDDDSFAEILGHLVFFTLASTIGKRSQSAFMTAAGGLWGSALTSLNCTEYRNSLPISTPEPQEGTALTEPLPS